MYFNNIAEHIDQVPNYFVSDIMTFSKDIIAEKDLRAIIGKGNTIQIFPKMTPQLQRTVTALSAYIISQQFPLLKNMVIHESLLVKMPATVGEILMPTRYLNRVGELFIVPIQGSGTIASAEFDSKVNLTVGQVTRINNRVNSRVVVSDDFVCAAFSFLDFDLKRYLMPHDLMSPFIRRKDEHIDPSAASEPEVVEHAY
jgi:hypothetical protein